MGGPSRRPEIRIVELKDLKPAPYNPRRIDKAALEGLGVSIERFGNVQPIVWNETTGNVVGGHQRLKILRKKKVPRDHVVVVFLSEEEERALNVALNNPHIAGEFTEDLPGLLDRIRQDDAELFASLRLDQIEIAPSSTDPANDPNSEWAGMPEFDQQDKTAFRSLVVHFKDQAAVELFTEVLGIRLTDKTRMLWFPKIEIETHADKAYA